MSEVVVAEFDSPEALGRAVTHAKGRTDAHVDAHTPYSTEVVRSALEQRPSRLGYAVFVGGIAGASAAYGLEWYLVAHDYPLNAGGRPPHMPLAFVPIAFEMGILFAAFTAFIGAFVLGRLVRLWDPVFEIDGFESVTVNRFWLAVRHESSSRPTSELVLELEELGARRVERRPD